MKKKYPILILAGAEKGALYETTGIECKACIPIKGKAMLDWVIEAFKKSPHISDIIVVGPENVDKLKSIKYVRKRIPQGNNIIYNIIAGIWYLKHVVYKSAKKHNGYLVSFCDAVFLRPDIIAHTLKNIEKSKSDFVLHYVEKGAYKNFGPSVKRTFIPVGSKAYTGSTIYYLKSSKYLPNLIYKLSAIRKIRKKPKQIMDYLKCEGKSLPQIGKALSKLLSIKVKLLSSPYPEMGMDVDKQEDLDFAEIYFNNRI
jgi:molybdopterin-guanine dinucleotide biosynthesis protein A